MLCLLSQESSNLKPFRFHTSRHRHEDAKFTPRCRYSSRFHCSPCRFLPAPIVIPLKRPNGSAEATGRVRMAIIPPPPAQEEDVMSKFLLLLNETPKDFKNLSPEAMQAMFERYRAWGASTREAGKLTAGQKLKEEGGRHLRSQGGRVEVTDGPYTETKEVLGGFYMIEAADYAEAVEIAKGCPHLDRGWIDVRQIEEM